MVLGGKYFRKILDVFHEDIPNCDNVANASCQNKEMEYRMHKSLLIDAVENGSSNVADALCDNPDNRGWGYGIYQRLECDKYR